MELCLSRFQSVLSFFTDGDAEKVRSIMRKASADRTERELLYVDTFGEKVSFFKSCTFSQRKAIYRICQCVDLDAKETLFRQGDYGDAFYIILQGSVDVVIASNKNTDVSDLAKGVANGRRGRFSSSKAMSEYTVATLGPAESFGERALHSEDRKRKASIIAAENSFLLRVGQRDYEEALSQWQAAHHREKHACLRSVHFMRDWSEEALTSFAGRVESRMYQPGTLVQRQGASVRYVFFVKMGSLKVLKAVTLRGRPLVVQVATLGPGDYWGEREVIEGRAHTHHSLVSDSHAMTELLVIGFKAFSLMALRNKNALKRIKGHLEGNVLNRTLSSAAIRQQMMERCSWQRYKRSLVSAAAPKFSLYRRNGSPRPATGGGGSGIDAQRRLGLDPGNGIGPIASTPENGPQSLLDAVFPPSLDASRAPAPPLTAALSPRRPHSSAATTNHSYSSSSSGQRRRRPASRADRARQRMARALRQPSLQPQQQPQQQQQQQQQRRPAASGPPIPRHGGSSNNTAPSSPPTAASSPSYLIHHPASKSSFARVPEPASASASPSSRAATHPPLGRVGGSGSGSRGGGGISGIRAVRGPKLLQHAGGESDRRRDPRPHHAPPPVRPAALSSLTPARGSLAVPLPSATAVVATEPTIATSTATATGPPLPAPRPQQAQQRQPRRAAGLLSQSPAPPQPLKLSLPHRAALKQQAAAAPSSPAVATPGRYRRSSVMHHNSAWREAAQKSSSGGGRGSPRSRPNVSSQLGGGK